MRIGLIALCSIVLSVSTVSTLEAARSHKKIEKKQNVKAKKSKPKAIKKTKAKKQTKKPLKKVAVISKPKDDFFDEPVIDGSKLNESSVVVDKNIKIASNYEKFADIKLASDDEEADTSNVLAQKNEIDQVDVQNKPTVVAQLDNSEDIFKEKIQQVNSDRKLYDLIRTPKKEIKDDIQVTKFREELEHYRKMYSSKLKEA